ncbi:transporter substrate-binding domain-containing protein [Cerasicoccus fimbriatus]|uniref:transporter substrate-binding domain-containing protein n=1 Tax=Cerasicoccus fimbriatus TaxID=3014554 RepID=UPI0022B5CA60|nr:transporter substrate-binding domain-containing protein [Cerasicoccus sp. TK19100]
MKQLLILITCLIVCTGLFAQDEAPAPAEKKKLIVATKDAPPFAFKDPSGEWTGITIEMWDAIAKKLGYDYELTEDSLEGVLRSVSSGKADIGAAAISVTAERAQIMDFTHTYYGSALGIATSYQRTDIWSQLFSRLFTWNFLKALFALIVVLLIAGALVWVFERKRNPEHFGGKPMHGLGAAFWWSAVTMTTVGYGDKAPATPAGRVVGLVWMFTSIIIISGMTGAIATALTVGSLTPRVKGPQDLHKVEVGTIQSSVADGYLKSIGVNPTYYNSVQEGLQAVDDEAIGAFVNDHAIIGYWAGKDFAGDVDVLRDTFEPSYLALAMPLDSEHQREIDLALLEFIQTPAWDAILAKYRAAQ